MCLEIPTCDLGACTCVILCSDSNHLTGYIRHRLKTRHTWESKDFTFDVTPDELKTKSAVLLRFHCHLAGEVQEVNPVGDCVPWPHSNYYIDYPRSRNYLEEINIIWKNLTFLDCCVTKDFITIWRKKYKKWISLGVVYLGLTANIVGLQMSLPKNIWIQGDFKCPFKILEIIWNWARLD